MSNIYIQEPPTNGKVLLDTSLGDIDIELWSKEAPKACRNFVQLCMEGYFNGTIFHRIVKGFIAQCGDPQGTGYGGESIYGKPFKENPEDDLNKLDGYDIKAFRKFSCDCKKDEFHQRLRFNRRGLLGMANSGPDDNRSQFFFTLDAAQELDKKHSLFGKVGGKTIYNLIRLNDLEVDGNERPLDPPKIFSAEILYNPFDDIEPRNVHKQADKVPNQEEKKKTKKKREKNFKLLSFGEEAEEDDGQLTAISKDIKIQSSHDLLNDPKLSTEKAVDVNPSERAAVHNVRQKLTKKREESNADHDSLSEDEKETEKKRRKAALKKEARELKRELAGHNNKKALPDAATKDSVEDRERPVINELMSQLRDEKRQFTKMKRESSVLMKGGSREKETLAMLTGFQSKLSSTEDATVEDLPENDSDIGWMGHTLKFESASSKAKDASIRDEDTFDIYDPRNPINQRRRETSGREDAKRARR